MSTTAKPEGYPYATLASFVDGWCGVIVDWHPHGYEQVTEVLDRQPDIQEAKRAAVSRAAALGVPYKSPIV